MKSLKEAQDLAQSWIDSYRDGIADETTIETLCDVAIDHCHILDIVINTRWFRNALVDFITSHEGMQEN
jgi:hypothetical protein